jgi:hypothetical protein
MQPAGGGNRGMGLAKASPNLIFRSGRAEKTIDAKLAKRVSGALINFPAAQTYFQSVRAARPAWRECGSSSTVRPFGRKEFASWTTSNSVASGCHPSWHEPLDLFCIPFRKLRRSAAKAILAARSCGCPSIARIHHP